MNTTPEEPRREGKPLAWKIKRGIWILVLVLILIFILQNIQSVSLTYWFWGFRWPLAVLVLITLIIGMLLGWALTRFVRRGRGRNQVR
jgi:uncharacterized integral membrane protein